MKPRNCWDCCGIQQQHFVSLNRKPRFSKSLQCLPMSKRLLLQLCQTHISSIYYDHRVPICLSGCRTRTITLANNLGRVPKIMRFGFVNKLLTKTQLWRPKGTEISCDLSFHSQKPNCGARILKNTVFGYLIPDLIWAARRAKRDWATSSRRRAMEWDVNGRVESAPTLYLYNKITIKVNFYLHYSL
jgi:hypothetical protein